MLAVRSSWSFSGAGGGEKPGIGLSEGVVELGGNGVPKDEDEGTGVLEVLFEAEIPRISATAVEDREASCLERRKRARWLGRIEM